jgi:hypothetical protein
VNPAPHRAARPNGMTHRNETRGQGVWTRKQPPHGHHQRGAASVCRLTGLHLHQTPVLPHRQTAGETGCSPESRRSPAHFAEWGRARVQRQDGCHPDHSPAVWRRDLTVKARCLVLRLPGATTQFPQAGRSHHGAQTCLLYVFPSCFTPPVLTWRQVSHQHSTNIHNNSRWWEFVSNLILAQTSADDQTSKLLYFYHYITLLPDF